MEKDKRLMEASWWERLTEGDWVLFWWAGPCSVNLYSNFLLMGGAVFPTCHLPGVQLWWTWVWVDSRSWWWTGRSGVLLFIGLKESDTTERLNWTELSMSPPIRTRPRFPLSQSLPPGSFHKPLILLQHHRYHRDPFILSGVISPLISSSILGTYGPR